jgi:hypothetical protein
LSIALLLRLRPDAGTFAPGRQFFQFESIHRGGRPVKDHRDIRHRVFYDIW